MYKALCFDQSLWFSFSRVTLKDGIVKSFCFYNSNNSWGWLDRVPKEVKIFDFLVILGSLC